MSFKDLLGWTCILLWFGMFIYEIRVVKRKKAEKVYCFLGDCRIWSRDLKQMFSDIKSVKFNNSDGKSRCVLRKEASTVSAKLEDVVILRRVGKTDIDGNDLYEGDILESEVGGQEIVICYGMYQAFCPADKSYMDSVGFYASCEGYPDMPIGNTEDYARKIGNIYENPNLVSTRMLERTRK